MASPRSKHDQRSQLIRELARDLKTNKADHSYASSTGSRHGTVSSDSTMTGKSFNPENEAIHSTGQWNFSYNPAQYDFTFEQNQSQNVSQKLPQLRDTAKKSSRWSTARQEPFIINTSALGQAFPDFSQGGSSEDDMSVEVGRGPSTRPRVASRGPQPQYSDNIDSPVVRIRDFEVRGTPPAKHLAKPLNKPQQQNASRSNDESQIRSAPRARKVSQPTRENSATPQKENIAPADALPASKKHPTYISGATRTSSGEQRRTLAELHAEVADDSQGSFLNDERPPTITYAAKSSRFSTNQKQDYQLATPSSNLRSSQNATQQSFLVPDMPDISKLVSGSLVNGGQVRATRSKINSRLTSHGPLPNTDGGSDSDVIPVPEDEKAIYLSLEILQDKVTTLEKEKIEFQRTIDDLQAKNERSEQERNRRSDSALGDSGSETDSRRLAADVARLEGVITTLSNRLESADLHNVDQGQLLRTCVSERDQALQELSKSRDSENNLRAKYRELANENAKLHDQLGRILSKNQLADFALHANDQDLRSENFALHKKLEKLIADDDKSARQWNEKLQQCQQAIVELQNRNDETTRRLQQKESLSERETLRKENSVIISKLERLLAGADESMRNWEQKERSYKEKLQRRDRAFLEMQRLTKELKIQNNSTRTTVTRGSGKSLGGMSKQKYDQQQYAHEGQRVQTSHTENSEGGLDETEEPQLNTSHTIYKDLNVHPAADNTNVSNFSSILGHGEMQSMRQLLTDLKKQNEEQRVDGSNEPRQDDTVRSFQSSRSMHTMLLQSVPQKVSTRPHSLKGGITGILKTNGIQDKGEPTEIKFSVKDSGHEQAAERSHRRRNSDNSVHLRDSPKWTGGAEEMTSAFIIPDVTLHGPFERSGQTILSDSAKCVLSKLARHDNRNCTLCTRVASFETKDTNRVKVEAKQKVHIEKPVPVSERMPETAPGRDEPTLRPKTAPGLALATVLKELQDELAHLKMQLAPYQAVYNKHDPSLSKRKRKYIKARMEELLKVIDLKADQIYALYDVLEGQKQSGQILTEEEVEITLYSIGVSFQKEDHAAEEQSDDEKGAYEDSDIDLPWEGIDETE